MKRRGKGSKISKKSRDVICGWSLMTNLVILQMYEWWMIRLQNLNLQEWVGTTYIWINKWASCLRVMGQKKTDLRPLECFFVKQIGTTYNLAIMEIMNSKNVFAFQLPKGNFVLVYGKSIASAMINISFRTVLR